MIKKSWAFYKKYEELINYLVVGVMTTAVSWATYALCKLVMDVDNAFWMQAAVFIRCAAGIVFSYVMSRIFVFKSKNPNILKEIFDFVTSRLVTVFLDMLIMWLLPSVFKVDDWIATFVSAVVVVIVNYIFSKFIVFRKKKA